MKTIWTTIVAGATTLLLAGCGTSPTADTSVVPSSPSYDGGFGMGSGSLDWSEDSTMTATTSSDTTARGGFTIGSGN